MHQTFLKLIQPIPIKGPLRIDKNELDKIDSIAQRHNLRMLIYNRLQKYHKAWPENSAAADYLKQRKSLYLNNAVHSMQQEAIEKEIVSLLTAERIPAMVIKGNEIAREIYNDPNCRTSSDIDILIKLSDTPRADSILTGAGLVRMDKEPLAFWFSRMHHAQYVHPKNQYLVEFHWNFAIPDFFKLTSEEIWGEMIRTDSGKFKLSPNMMLILLLTHHHMHTFRDIKILTDILWTLHAYEDKIDWRLFAEQLVKIGLVRSTRITLNQIQTLWGDAAREMRCIKTLDQEMCKTGHKTPGFLISYFKMDIEKSRHGLTKKDVIVFRFALDRWPVIIFSFLKTAFPFPGAIKALYNDNRDRTLPVNYLRFIKWRVNEWRG